MEVYDKKTHSLTLPKETSINPENLIVIKMIINKTITEAQKIEI